VTEPLGLLLAPGASSDRNQAALVAIDSAATAAGLTVVRMDFPYRQAGRRAPDRAPVLVQAVVDEAARLAPRVGAIVLGGRSMGGRMCSLAVAEGTPAAGLVLISYPLHPPGRMDKLRTEHFPRLDVPCLFVSGTRDAFGSPTELEGATAAIPGAVTHHWIEGKSHGLRGADAELVSVVVPWVESLGGRPRRLRRARRVAPPAAPTDRASPALAEGGE
jgi:predicted alpha/beta-hydrolase family hydrolase